MTTATATPSHYNVFAITDLGEIRLGVFTTLQDALDYRDLVGVRQDEVWVVFADGSSERVA